jgi:CheY-like chemotaxis protein
VRCRLMSGAEAVSMPVILIVEDDAVIHELVTVALQDEGFDVVEAQDSPEALVALEKVLSQISWVGMWPPWI